MADPGERRIEIFAPFSAALDRTKLILFQPFDIGKWFIIGFAAFLAHLAGGGGGGGMNPGRMANGGHWNWNVRSTTNDVLQSTTSDNLSGCVIAAIAIIGVMVLALVVVLLWVGARGRFIFTDCIVRNRAAIVEPWHEFRREGNSYFAFALVVAFALLVLLGLTSLPLWLPFILTGDHPRGPALVLPIVALVGIAAAAALAIAIPSRFMVPIMYRQRCTALVAYKSALSMIMSAPGPVVLYFLFLLVLAIAFGIVACLTTCLTCCIAALPYLGTVILLPFHVFFASYLLLFMRQFGPEFDVWANVTAAPGPPP